MNMHEIHERVDDLFPTLIWLAAFLLVAGFIARFSHG